MEFSDQVNSFFENFFTNFFTIDSIAILFTAIVSFLLGMLINRLRLGSKMKKLRQQIQTKDNQIAALNATSKNLQEELEFKAADIQRANLELTQVKDRVSLLETEKGQLHTDLFTANEEIERLNGDNGNYSATIEDLHDQILGLKTRNQQLLQNGGDHTDTLGVLNDDTAALDRLDALEQKLDRLESENTTLKNQLANDELGSADIDQTTVQRLLALDEKLSDLEVENQLLKAELDKLKIQRDNDREYADVAEDGADNTERSGLLGDASDMETVPRLKMDKEVLGEQLVADGTDKDTMTDDLTKIEGIGPFIATKLRKIGIRTYQDIADMDTARIAQVTQDIGFFPGRIERDDWVGQAKGMLGQAGLASYGEMETARRISIDNLSNINAEDDLKTIEGIGDKVEQLLKSSGIMNWHQLADASVEQLNEILTNGGDRFGSCDPTTWPDQARLAADGEWEKLKTYQNYLEGGRDTGGRHKEV
ncbi:MAG: helix-hairpin-helix domain-containing protein [Bacteroidota bacterium]